MKKIAFVTDSNSGFSRERGEELGVNIIPMPFYINGELLYEGVSLTKEEFFSKLVQEDAEISTSQPSPGDVMDMYEKLLEEYDEIIHIPMTAGLSSTHDTAAMLAQDYDGRVHVVDNRRVSVTLLQSMKDAIKLAGEGKSGAEIKEILEAKKSNAAIYLAVDTLKYLKKGGRISPAAAAIGSVLSIKPILFVGEAQIEPYAKARGAKQAKKATFEALAKKLEEVGDSYKVNLYMAHTMNDEDAQVMLVEAQEKFPEHTIEIADLSLSIACHVGPGGFAFALAEEL